MYCMVLYYGAPQTLKYQHHDGECTVVDCADGQLVEYDWWLGTWLVLVCRNDHIRMRAAVYIRIIMSCICRVD